MSLFPAAQAALAYPAPLAEKYRPRRIDGFIGLDKPKKVLAAFAKRPTPSAWLFVGPPGVGKTTMALALAEELGAELHHIPSQKCTAAEIDYVALLCQYVPLNGGFHVVVCDEADRMTEGAQLCLLSKLDATAFPPNTIFVFTCNGTDGLEKRFLSRCRVLEFSSYGMRDSLAAFLGQIWESESSSSTRPDYARIAKDATNNVRDALMRLEVELLSQ